MGIVYLITVLMLLVAFVLVKKTEKEINIVSFIGISIVTLFCYNAFICYVLTFFTIPITLWLLSLINLLVTVFFTVLMIKNKETQEYTFNKLDLIFVCIIAVIVLVISYINFGFPFNVKYETSDPAVHYLAANMFARSDSLLMAEKEVDEIYGSLNTMKTASYVNSGLLMKALCKDLNSISTYNIFVWFGIFTLFLIGTTLYSTMANIARKKEHTIWAFIISIICMLGYPLNSFLFGFEYLTMGLLIICAVIGFVYCYEKEIIYIKWFIPLMALLNFGLFCSYYMFVPFVYPTLWIYFYIKNYQKTKKIISKEIIILWVITLLTPFILGYIYYMAPQIYKVIINMGKIDVDNIMSTSTYLMESGFKKNGYIYVNLYSNMLPLLPLAIYFFVKLICNKDIDIFGMLLLIFNMIFIGILFIGRTIDKVSTYYMLKNYFPLWIILLYCNYRALILLSEKSSYLPRLFIGAYIFFMIICIRFSNFILIDDVLENIHENVFTQMEIFEVNNTMLIKESEKLNQEELDILMYARNNLDYNSEIEIVSKGIQYYWSYVFMDYINYEEILNETSMPQIKLNTKAFLVEDKINKVDYMIYFKRSEKYEEVKDKLFENAEIIYKNSSGGILKYKK